MKNYNIMKLWWWVTLYERHKDNIFFLLFHPFNQNAIKIAVQDGISSANFKVILVKPIN